MKGNLMKQTLPLGTLYFKVNLPNAMLFSVQFPCSKTTKGPIASG